MLCDAMAIDDTTVVLGFLNVIIMFIVEVDAEC
jgi:hypothetical protein